MYDGRSSVRVVSLAIAALGLALAALVLVAATTTVQAQLPWPTYSINKIIDYPSGGLGVEVGEVFTVTLVFENQWTQSRFVEVRDRNPAPQYLEILPNTITGGAYYTPTLDAVAWDGSLGIGGPAMVSFQMRAIGGTGRRVSNYAYLDDPLTMETLPDAQVWKDIYIGSGGLAFVYLPLALHNWPPSADAPSLLPISNPDGDQAFTVNWSAVAGADTYILGETTDSAFTTPAEVYSGPLTQYDATGRGPTRYYYRVKSRNSWGDSDWSNMQSVDVLWELEPNDIAPAQANGPLVSGPIYYGQFLSGGDINDYFLFDLSTTANVDLSLSNIAFGQNYDLVLRDQFLASRPGWYSGNIGNADEHISAPLAPGRYYIQVHNRGLSGSTQPYHLQLVY